MDAVLFELETEAATTRRILERVPEESLSWRPHEKSMSLGQLALHIATNPGMVSGMLAAESFQVDPSAFDNLPQAASRAEILDALDKSVAAARSYVKGLDAEKASATWRLLAGGQELLAAPRAGVIRMVMLNHWYHHRGQLTVYLRLLNVPVPVVYGRSADEGPFAKATGANG